jgi:hypothetical protein
MLKRQIQMDYSGVHILQYLLFNQHYFGSYEGVPKRFQNDAAARAVILVRDSAASYLFNLAFSVSVPSSVNVKGFVYLL